MTGSAFLLALAVAFGDGSAADPFPSVVAEVLPLPPSPPYRENDPRVRTWFYAYCLAWRIDARGRLLAKPDVDQDVASELKQANYRDLVALADALARLRTLEANGPVPVLWVTRR